MDLEKEEKIIKTQIADALTSPNDSEKPEALKIHCYNWIICLLLQNC